MDRKFRAKVKTYKTSLAADFLNFWHRAPGYHGILCGVRINVEWLQAEIVLKGYSKKTSFFKI